MCHIHSLHFNEVHVMVDWFVSAWIRETQLNCLSCSTIYGVEDSPQGGSSPGCCTGEMRKDRVASDSLEELQSSPGLWTSSLGFQHKLFSLPSQTHWPPDTDSHQTPQWAPDLSLELLVSSVQTPCTLFHIWLCGQPL